MHRYFLTVANLHISVGKGWILLGELGIVGGVGNSWKGWK
jgi:hypothetical protein